MKLLVVCALLVVTALGHNGLSSWSRGYSRVGAAESLGGVCPSPEKYAHVQVAARQYFEVEWTGAHTGGAPLHYFTVVHASNTSHLTHLNTYDLEEYLSGARNATDDSANPYFRKYHVRRAGSYRSSGLLNRMSLVNYNESVPHWRRPGSFQEGFGSADVFYYFDKFVENDVHAEYTHPEYPFIEAMWRFSSGYDEHSEHDGARLLVPALSGPGKYVVWYSFGGYSDCIDVEVVAAATDDPHPSLLWEWDFQRVDHCMVRHPLRSRIGAFLVVSSAEQCMNVCASRTLYDCAILAVVPFYLPTGVRHRVPAADRIPWEAFPEEDTKEIHSADLPGDAMICYATSDGSDVFSPNGRWVVSDDPEDVAFYSTCYIKSARREFTNGVEAGEPLPNPARWHFGDKCISCRDYAYNQLPEVVPVWRPIDECIDCDAHPYRGDVRAELEAERRADVIHYNKKCDGYDGEWIVPSRDRCPAGEECYKFLKVPGSSRVLLDECRKLAEADANCSDVFIYNEVERECRCYKSLECCGTCVPATESQSHTYQFPRDGYSAGYSQPDPTCATGVLSANGTDCCPAECIAQSPTAACGGADCRVLDGMCCLRDHPGNLNPDRNCSVSGPPCYMR